MKPYKISDMVLKFFVGRFLMIHNCTEHRGRILVTVAGISSEIGMKSQFNPFTWVVTVFAISLVHPN